MGRGFRSPLVLLLLVLICVTPSRAEETGVVTASALALRTGPGTEYDRICDIPSNASLQLLAYDASGWYRVGYDGKLGYVWGRYVRVTETRSTSKGEMPDVSAFIAAGNNPGYPMILKFGDMGNSVLDLQHTLKNLGYGVDADSSYGEVTQKAVISLQKQLGLQADGVIGKATRYAIGRTGDRVELLDWWRGGNTAFPRFGTAMIVDVRTGLRLTVWRFGGDSHADVEPFTAEDAKTLLAIYNGAWSWDRRPVWLMVNGRVIAASMNGMPHDGYRIADNGFDGHFCLHLLNSRVHATDALCPLHQAAVFEAYDARDQYR